MSTFGKLPDRERPSAKIHCGTISEQLRQIFLLNQHWQTNVFVEVMPIFPKLIEVGNSRDDIN